MRTRLNGINGFGMKQTKKKLHWKIHESKLNAAHIRSKPLIQTRLTHFSLFSIHHRGAQCALPLDLVLIVNFISSYKWNLNHQTQLRLGALVCVCI